MVRLAIIGTGGMATGHAREFGKDPDCEVVAACDVDVGRVRDFAKRYGIRQTFIDMDVLLDDCDCDAVAIVVPDPLHHPLSLKAIRAGKHVFCEKPLGLNYQETAEMRDAADKAGLINMVNFSYRDSSAIQKASALVAAGALGTIRHVHAHYHQSWLIQDAWGDWRSSPGWLWRLSQAHGSAGVLGDLGIHLLDFASMPLGTFSSVHCKTKTFAKKEGARVMDYDLDANDSAIITAEFSNGALGTLHMTRWAYPHVNSLRLDLFGEAASIQVDLDWSYTQLLISRVLEREAMPWEVLECGQTPSNYERFIRAIETGQRSQPDFARGAEMQAVLDACRKSAETDRTIPLEAIKE